MVEISEEEFEEAVGDALDLVPPALMNAVDNVEFLMEEEHDRGADGRHRAG